MLLMSLAALYESKQIMGVMTHLYGESTIISKKNFIPSISWKEPQYLHTTQSAGVSHTNGNQSSRRSLSFYSFLIELLA